MDCYYHPDTKAVALCRECSRGLCHECCHDEGYGIACKDKHEAQVKAVQNLIQTNLNSISDAPQNMWLVPMLYFVIGIISILNAVLNPATGTYHFLLAFGSICVMFALVNAWRSYRIFGRKK